MGVETEIVERTTVSAGVGTAVGRVLLAMLLSVLVTGTAVGALHLTEMPAVVSLALEPLSLLLMPGMFYGMAVTRDRDIESMTIVWGALGFYALFFYGLLWWRGRRSA